MTFSTPFSRCFLSLSGAAALLALAACAPLNYDTVPQAGRVAIGLPAGDWVDLGSSSEAVPTAGIDRPAPIRTQTRAVGLRGSQGEVLAVIQVQASPSLMTTERTSWQMRCPEQEGVQVEDFAKGSPERIDCLRVKRRVERDGWLAKAEPQAAEWLQARQVPLPYNATLVSHRYANGRGAFVWVNAYVDSRLLEPKTRNNEQFLVAGQPAHAWAQALASATRKSTGMLDGRLDVPPFPLPLPVGAAQEGGRWTTTSAGSAPPPAAARAGASGAQPVRAP